MKNGWCLMRQNIFAKTIIPILIFLGIFISWTCGKQDVLRTSNQIIVVMDGPRYSETWGDSSGDNIPYLKKELALQGVLFTGFYNLGPTRTISGHTALLTGFYEDLDNSGIIAPAQPSIFQRWLKFSGEDQNKAWFITSKGKLGGLLDTRDPAWTGKYIPAGDCGVDGKGLEAGKGSAGYREDGETWQRIQSILYEDQPRLVLINFKAPDTFDKENAWENYLEAIRKTDEYVYQLWNFIQSDPFYQNKTALYITSDHGRHLDGTREGFLSHGDNCEGCQHVALLAIGPDFKKGVVVETPHQLIDLPLTIARMMGFAITGSQGKFLQELFDE